MLRATLVIPADLWLIIRAIVLLPPRVAWFYVRAHILARWRRDGFSLVAPARPKDLSQLLAAARGRSYAVELGTGTAWTAICLALAEPSLQMVSYDPVEHPGRAWYLGLVSSQVRDRIHFRNAVAQQGPMDGDPPVEFLFIDIGGHSRADTAAAFLAWCDSLAVDSVAAFHDYGQRFPGVAMAVAQLGLKGTQIGESLFVSRFPQAGSD
jgi:Methyltransferase domain